jgi:RNA polymerase sigma-70 factor (subfamily 1)
VPPSDDWPWERYRGYLLELARLLRNRLNPRLQRRFHSSDLVQETLLRAVKGRSKYRGGPGEVEQLAWLRKILRNYTIERIIKETGQGNDPRLEIFIDKVLNDSSRRLEDLVDKQPSPSEGAQNNEQIVRFYACLQLLPELQRKVIQLHGLEELSIKETALQLGLKSDRSASGLFARGLAQVRKLFDSDG